MTVIILCFVIILLAITCLCFAADAAKAEAAQRETFTLLVKAHGEIEEYKKLYEEEKDHE